jgi:hypothetical protein
MFLSGWSIEEGGRVKCFLPSLPLGRNVLAEVLFWDVVRGSAGVSFAKRICDQKVAKLR